jgi:hypothetical protein
VGNVTGGLVGKNWYGDAYTFGSAGAGAFANAPNAGNRFVYGYQPTLNVAPASSLTYSGSVPSAASAVTISGVLAGDSAGDAWSGAAALAGLTSKNVGTYTVTPSLGTLASGLNYAFSFSSGTLTITPAALSISIIGNPTKMFDRTIPITLSSANYSLAGFLAGESATVTQSAGTFNSFDAGVRPVRAVLAPGDFTATPGTDLSNYLLPTLATGVGTIDQKPLSISFLGNIAVKTYDGSTTATLPWWIYVLTGFMPGETANVRGTVGVFDSPNAGSRTVTASIAPTDYIAIGGANLNNYILPTSASGLLTINARPLSVSLIGALGKTYDGSAASSLTAANFSLTGFVAGQGGSVTQTSGTYDSADAGARILTVNLAAGDYALTGGALASNYDLPTDVSGSATIDPRVLTASIIGNPTKTYDGSASATLAYGNFSVSGVAAGETLTVTKTSGAYSSANAGSRTVSTSLAAGDFALTGGTLANYVLPTSATGVGTIDPRVLTASIIGNPTKTFDGSAAATLTAANYSLTGLVGTEGFTVTQTSGTYDSANAGARTVTANLGVGNFTGTGGGLISNYSFAPTATGVGAISQKTLTAIVTGNPAKTYDGNTTATLTAGNYSLSGFVGSDGATVTKTVGTFNSANAGLPETGRSVTVALAASDYSATGTTRLSNYILPTSAAGAGVINRATLTLSAVTARKTYDGGVAATGTPTAAGLKGSDTVTGLSQSFDSQNAGTRTVNVSQGYGVNDGNGGGNYTVTLNTASGVIAQRVLAISADNKDKIAGAVDPPLTWTLASGALVSGEALTGALTRDPGEGVGFYAILQGSLTAGANYQINFTNGQFEVRPKPFDTPIIPNIPIILSPPGSTIARPPIRSDLPLSRLTNCNEDPDEEGDSDTCKELQADSASL